MSSAIQRVLVADNMFTVISLPDRNTVSIPPLIYQPGCIHLDELFRTIASRSMKFASFRL